MKRDSVNFDQSYAVDDDEAKAKLKYQSLLKEYLELQKGFVSKKRKLQAAKQKRDTILAEVRFLSRRHKYLLENRASNTGKANSDIKTNALEGERNQRAPLVAAENSDRVAVSNSHLEDEAEEEGEQQVLEKEVTFGKKPKNYLIKDKGTGKRNIFWPNKVNLKDPPVRRSASTGFILGR